jgi:epoxyqueuosine reductase
MHSEYRNTQQIKSFASQLGFEFCGIAKAAFLEDDARRLEKWLGNHYQAGMGYMANHFDMRVDPRKLVPDAKSVITLLMNYFPEEEQTKGLPKVARYAFGKDYHEVIRKKLNTMLSLIRESIGAVNGRGFVDSAPVLERSWAVKSGLGWIGKNGNLIHKQSGSFFFIATIITDLQLTPDDPYSKDYCGNCRRCIDACPTGAILPDKTINGGQCISYFTIELKEALIPESSRSKFNDWMFGCDICQEVCPWNRFSTPNQTSEFRPLREFFEFGKKEWEELTEEQFNKIFKDSPLKRAKWKGIRRNLGL